MKPTEVTLDASGNSSPIVLNRSISPVDVGFGVVKTGTGDVTFTVQHCFDDLSVSSSATWFDHSDVSGKTASIDGSYKGAITGIRLRVTDVSGAFVTTLKVVQAGE